MRNGWQLGPAANHQAYLPSEVRTWVEALETSGHFVGHAARGWAPGVARAADGEPRELTGP